MPWLCYHRRREDMWPGRAMMHVNLHGIKTETATIILLSDSLQGNLEPVIWGSTKNELSRSFYFYKKLIAIYYYSTLQRKLAMFM